jgi:hypothetical protein
MLKRILKKEIELMYSDQSVMIIEQIKGFDYNKFEEEYFNQIIIGDQTIWKYLIEKASKMKEGK